MTATWSVSIPGTTVTGVISGDLTSVQPAPNTVFSLSPDVNDKDKGVRKGYTQWGDGIGASKDVAGFDMAQLMPARGRSAIGTSRAPPWFRFFLLSAVARPVRR